MLTPALAGHLVRWGVRWGAAPGAARRRAVGVGLATFALAAALLAMCLAHATYEGRIARIQAREGKVVGAGSPDAVAWWSGDLVDDVDDQPVTLVGVSPVTADAVPPPGVHRWPAAGEAVVSPALRDLLGADRADRYGTVVGTVGDEGLVDADELLVYVGMPHTSDLADRAQAVSGFGASEWYSVPAAYAYQADEPLVLRLLLVAGAVPAVLLLFVAARAGSGTRDRRVRLLRTLGAGRPTVAVSVLAEVATPWALGLGAAVLGFAALGLRPVALPGLHLTLNPDDVARAVPYAGAAMAGAVIVSLLVVLVSPGVLGRCDAPRRWWPRRHGARPGPPLGRAGLFVAVVVATWWGAGRAATMQNSQVFLLVHLMGTVALMPLLPPAAATALWTVGEVAARLGHRRGLPGAIVGGRRLQDQTGPTARIVAGLAGAVLLLGLVQVFTATRGPLYDQAVKNRALYAGSVLTGYGRTGPSIDAFVEALPDDVAVLWVVVVIDAQGGTSSAVHGTCADLTTVGLGCPDEGTVVLGAHDLAQVPARVRAVVQQESGMRDGAVTVAVAPARTAPALAEEGADEAVSATPVLVAAPGTTLDLDALRRTGLATVPGGMGLGTPDQAFIVHAVTQQHQGAWVHAGGLWAFMLMLGAGVLAVATETARGARDLAPLLVAWRRPATPWSVAALRLGAPLALAGVLGCGVYLFMPSAMVAVRRSVHDPLPVGPSGTLALALVLASLLAGLVATALGAAAARRATRAWAPGAGEETDRT